MCKQVGVVVVLIELDAIHDLQYTDVYVDQTSPTYSIGVFVQCVNQLDLNGT